ncbi:hypothetical protein C0993_000565 [Termitomyces sp. T159_Od127]|nr:hypothetical protein C0993_000565 [Termitomyces sp. T159_Od127]
METTIRFGLTEIIQTSVASEIQAALISKILEEASTSLADSTGGSPERDLSVLQNPEDEEKLESSVKPVGFMGALTAKENTVATSSSCEDQSTASSPFRTQLTPSKYEPGFEQEDPITLNYSDPVRPEVPDSSSFSSSCDTYRDTPIIFGYPKDRCERLKYFNHTPNVSLAIGKSVSIVENVSIRHP